MLIAPRAVRSRSGNSSIATSLAEYTLAPASLTRTLTGLGSSCPRTSATKLSVSRPAVPLPMATSSTWCFRIRPARVAAACARSRSDLCGCRVTYSRSFPVRSTAATLHPVRNPGSIPSVGFIPAGLASRSSRRLVSKVRIDSRSAACFFS